MQDNKVEEKKEDDRRFVLTVCARAILPNTSDGSIKVIHPQDEYLTPFISFADNKHGNIWHEPSISFVNVRLKELEARGQKVYIIHALCKSCEKDRMAQQVEREGGRSFA